MQEEEEFISELLNSKTRDKAFEKLLLAYHKPLYYHIRNIVLNHDDADDVVQNTFIKIFNNLINFKGESKLYSWMYRIATNEALTFIKQKSHKNKVSIEELQFETISDLASDIYFDGDEIQLKLQKAVTLLPERQQMVFRMKYFQELKYEEISTILGISVGAIKASYHHAVKKIEIYLISD